MKIKGIMGAAGASIALALAAPAWVIAQAQQSPDQQQQQMPFQQADQNQDGFIDQNEAQQARMEQQQFQQADQDGDSRLDQSEYQTAMGQSIPPDQQMAQQQPEGDSQLMSMTAEELNGMSIVTQQGDTLGEVSQVAIDRQMQQPHVVMSVGGFLGLGGERVAIPISELQLQGEQLVASGISSADQLRGQPQYAYQEDNFQEVEGAQQLGQVAGGQPGQQQASFEQLDQDGDGYVSRDEAQQYPPLAENWQDADANSDGQLDSVEFSAFESQSGQPQQQPEMQQQEPPAGMEQQQQPPAGMEQQQQPGQPSQQQMP